jgi:hypothetical protein
MKPRDRLVVAIVAVVAIAGSFWFFALAPKRERATEVAALVAKAEARRDVATAKAAKGEQAKDGYPADYATVAKLGKALPAKADVPSLLFQLETAARAAKVDFRKMTVEDTPLGAPPTATPASGAATPSGIAPSSFTFTFEGTFVHLTRMLREIGKFSAVKGPSVSISGRLLTVDQVKLSAGRVGLPILKAEVTAKAYVAAIPSTLPGHSTPTVAAPATTPPTTTAAVTP